VVCANIACKCSQEFYTDQVACAEISSVQVRSNDASRPQVRGLVAPVWRENDHGEAVVAAQRATVLLRLAYYLMVSNMFVVLRLLSASERVKDADILVLRHQVVVWNASCAGKRVRFTPADRALLATLARPRGPGRQPRSDP